MRGEEPTLASSRLRSSESERRAAWGSALGVRASTRPLWATICLAISSAWRCVSSTTTRVSWARWRNKVVATTTRMSRVMVEASLVLRLPRMLDAVAVQLVVEGLEADAEELGRPRLVVAHRGERLENDVALHVFESHGDPPARRRGRGRRGVEARLHRQLGPRDQLARAADDRALDGIAELAHVTRPVVAHQESQGRLVDPSNLPLVLRVEFLAEGLHEEGDVLAPRSERRERHQAHVE